MDTNTNTSENVLELTLPTGMSLAEMGLVEEEATETVALENEVTQPENDTPAPEIEKPAAETPKEEPAGDFSKVFETLSGATGTPVKSTDDVTKYISDLKAQIEAANQRDPFEDLPEFVKKGVEFAKNSSDPQKAYIEWAKIQSTDFDVLLKENPEAIIKMGLKDQFPNLTDAEIERKFKKDFPKKDEDDFDTDEDYQEYLADLNLDIKLKSTEYVTALKAKQEERSQPDMVKRQKEQEALQAKAHEAYVKSAAQYLQGIKTNGFDLDGTNFKVEIHQEDGTLHPAVKNAMAAVENPVKWLEDNLMDPNTGLVNPGKLFEMIYISENYKKMAGVKATAASTKAVEDELKRVENPSGGGKRTGPVTNAQGAMSMEDAIAGYMFGRL